MELNDAVTAVAAFVGGFIGQRTATGKLAEDVAALKAQVQTLERRGRRQWMTVAALVRRMRAVESRREA